MTYWNVNGHKSNFIYFILTSSKIKLVTLTCPRGRQSEKSHLGVIVFPASQAGRGKVNFHRIDYCRKFNFLHARDLRLQLLQARLKDFGPQTPLRSPLLIRPDRQRISSQWKHFPERPLGDTTMSLCPGFGFSVFCLHEIFSALQTRSSRVTFRRGRAWRCRRDEFTSRTPPAQVFSDQTHASAFPVFPRTPVADGYDSRDAASARARANSRVRGLKPCLSINKTVCRCTCFVVFKKLEVEKHDI